MRRLFVFVLLLCACRSPGRPAPCGPGDGDDEAAAPLHDRTVFPALVDALSGQWLDEDGTLVLDTRPIARGSALAQHWWPLGSAPSLDVVHPHGDTVLLTHYCMQGNQARLRVTSATRGRFVFERFDVTNLAPGGDALCKLEVLREPDTLRLRETYCPGDGTTTERVLRRAAAP